jgi:hypothetical protein
MLTGYKEYTDSECELLGDILKKFYFSDYSIEEVRAYLSPASGYAISRGISLAGSLTRLEEVKMQILAAPIDEMPLLINSVLNTAKIIAIWRLSIGR